MKYILLSFLQLIAAVLFNLYSQTRPDQIINISNSPVSSFKQFCSRCHGYEGRAYGKDFGDMDNEELKKIIREMMVGPAQLKPEEIEIEAMYSYNKSLRDNKPFAIVMNSKSFLKGEVNNLLISVSPETKLDIKDIKQIKIEEVNDMYKLYYNPEKIKKLEITVTKKNISSSFKYPEKLWSE